MSDHIYSGMVEDSTGDVIRCGYVKADSWTPIAGQTVYDHENDGMPEPSINRGQLGATEMTRRTGPGTWTIVPQP